MSKNIWHTKDEIPRQESRVLWKSGNAVCGGRFDTYYKCFCGPASQFVDLKSVSRWVYIDDLLALETELERTRKALEIAVSQLKKTSDYIEDCRYQETNYFLVDSKDVSIILDETNDALEQITATRTKG